MNLQINGVEVLRSTQPVLSSSGLFQINLIVPAGLGTGDVPLVASTGFIGEGAVFTPPTVVISLQ